jgi:hypothetical protein
MLKLSEFRHNYHPSEVRMLAKFIRRGFSGYNKLGGVIGPCKEWSGHERRCRLSIFQSVHPNF